MNFNANRINAGIDAYNEIMREVNSPLFCTPSFRKLYNGFYRLRQKPKTWYDTYYEVFEMCKTNNMTFKEVLEEMFNRTGEVHPSFCSKIIATLNPDKPIWDQYVLQWLGINLHNFKKGEELKKINYYCDLYQQIEDEYNAHLNDKNIQESFRDFDRLIPNGTNLTKIKKLDFMLWSNRSDRTVSILDYNKLLDEINNLKS